MVVLAKWKKHMDRYRSIRLFPDLFDGVSNEYKQFEGEI